MNRVRIGQLLKSQGLIDDAQLVSALTFQRDRGGRLGDALLRLRLVREGDLLAALAQQAGVPMVHIGNQAIPLKVIKLLPEKLIRRRNVLPLAILAKSPHRPLLVATSAPSNLSLRDEVAFVARMRVIPALASDRDIEQAIARYFDVIARSDEMPWDATGAADLVDSPDTHVPLHTGRISTGYPFV